MHTVPPSSQAREGGEGGWATTAPEQLGRHSRGEEEAEIDSEPRGGKKREGIATQEEKKTFLLLRTQQQTSWFAQISDFTKKTK